MGKLLQVNIVLKWETKAQYLTSLGSGLNNFKISLVRREMVEIEQSSRHDSFVLVGTAK